MTLLWCAGEPLVPISSFVFFHHDLLDGLGTTLPVRHNERASWIEAPRTGRRTARLGDRMTPILTQPPPSVVETVAPGNAAAGLQYAPAPPVLRRRWFRRV